MAGEKEKTEQHIAGRNKGGRPRKEVARRQHLAVKCSRVERMLIEANARKAGLKVSVFLRELGLKMRLETRPKTLPKEVLALTGILNHMAANLNQMAKKRNGLDDLSPLERADLKILSMELKSFVAFLKNYLYDR